MNPSSSLATRSNSPYKYGSAAPAATSRAVRNTPPYLVSTGTAFQPCQLDDGDARIFSYTCPRFTAKRRRVSPPTAAVGPIPAARTPGISVKPLHPELGRKTD